MAAGIAIQWVRGCVIMRGMEELLDELSQELLNELFNELPRGARQLHRDV